MIEDFQWDRKINDFQERKVSKAIIEQPISTGPQCAVSVSDVLDSSNIFESYLNIATMLQL